MGQRANFVILKNRNWHLHYDHWCADRLDVEFFWGPAYATSYIQQRKPMKNRDDWLDAVWCEGGAIIDHDKHQLLWFGGMDILYDIPLRNALLVLMSDQWIGWTVKWAAGGIVELGAYLGYPANKFLNEREPDTLEKFFLNAEYPEHNNFLLTVREHGLTTVTRICGVEESLELGSSQLKEILHFTRQSRIKWNGEMPIGGLHIDLDDQSLYYWFATDTCELDERVTRGWHGWKCINLVDQYEKHLELVNDIQIELPLRTPAELQRDIIQRIRKTCHEAESNPAKSLLKKMGGEGELSPWTDITRGSYGTELEKIKLLDEIELRLQNS